MNSHFMINITPGHAKKVFSDDEFDLNGVGVVEVVSKNNKIRPRKDDEIILLDYLNDKSRVKADNYILKYKATIDSVELPTIALDSDLNRRELTKKENARKKGDSLIYYNHKINLIYNGIFEENPNLEDYTYSLLTIDNYKDPQRHFSNKITALNKNDFETLYRERIYATRTVLGRLIHALPQENRLEFILNAMEKFNTPELKDVTCSLGLRFLNDYLNDHILELGKFLIASKSIMEEELSDFLDPSLIGFDYEGYIDSTGLSGTLPILEDNSELIQNIGDNIFAQAELFKDALAYYGNAQTTIKVILDNQQRSQSEIRFNELFEKKRWPINIRI